MNLDDRITYIGLRAFNFLYDVGAICLNGIKQGLSDFSAYMAGRYNIWHFLEGEIGPLPDSVVHNRSIANIQWTYDVTSYKLTHNHNVGLQVTSEHPWLTAAIRMGNFEYDMDEFIRRFKWVSNVNIYPSRKLLLYTWSIHSGIWLSRDDNPILRVITYSGDQVDINIYDNNDDSWRRLLVGEESDSDNSTVSGNEDDSESESESDDSESESDDSEESGSDDSSEPDSDDAADTLPSSNDHNTSDVIPNDINYIPSPILQAMPGDTTRIESGELVEMNE
jgi:hypothetical protein